MEVKPPDPKDAALGPRGHPAITEQANGLA
jgi:hypothetical protein